ncbi:phage portal protein [Ralstonia insidiosa]|uniref:Phage portal protein n=1 Tax=Ralstonia insidiosa TaxID=190721 RepID=A0A848NVX4_9RALS|nr:phage portal protein [Ralstonia insidiosa]NMV37235.1 phage portal protein [Ralstonia insidiosa]
MSRGQPVQIPKPTIIDRVVGYLSPAAGLERMRSRVQMAIAGQWFGARFDRRATQNWAPYGGSADADTVYDLRWLRNRSRDAMRNQPLALGAVNTVVTTAVGTGLVMRSTVDAATLGMSEDEAQAWQRKAEREFRLWAKDANSCDAARTQDFYAIQALAFRSALESGDVFASLPMIKRPGSVYETKVQLIEADRVVNKGYAMNTEKVAQGVEMDDNGAPIKYHILRQHPGGLMPFQLEWDVVPVFGPKTGRRNILHLFDKRRPGQSRGVPYIAPVIELLKQLGDYTNAEVTAAVISGMFTVFITSEDGGGLNPGSDVMNASTSKPGATLQMGPGAILDLSPGEKVEFADPKRPNQAFDPFVIAVLRQIGVALELPFEVLVKHFTASYSAARAALLEAWRFYKSRRDWLASMFCQPIYEAWLEEAVALGRIDAPGFFDDPTIRGAYCGAIWVGDAPGQIDPLKEINAAKGRLELNITSHSDECVALTGADWDSTIERRAREDARMRELGLVTVYAPLSPANLNGPVPQPAPAKPGSGNDDAPSDDDASDLENA